MKLLIGIATYKRLDKLKRLLESLKSQTYQKFTITVVCDNNDYETHDRIINEKWFDLARINTRTQNTHKFVIGAWNFVVKENIPRNDWDGFIGLCDDVELKEDALQKAVDFHKDRYADGDGVIGFNQECPGHPEYTFKWFGQTLIGRKFIERYKDVNYQICCPYYIHLYQDEELHQYASSLDKFYPCKQAILYHYHPGFIKEELDETHKLSRTQQIRKQDLETFTRRQKEGKIWGWIWEK